MNERLSLSELAHAVNGWCEEHQIVPANGQAGEALSERNLRYYRSLGLIDPPVVGGGQGYGEKHRLQVSAIRLLQAQGLPLSRIRELLFGRDLAELRQIERQGLAERAGHRAHSFRPTLGEFWAVFPLDDSFLLVSRRGESISQEKREQILEILKSSTTSPCRKT